MYRCFERVGGVGSDNYLYFRNLKDYLMKILQLLLQVVIHLTHNQVTLVLKQERNWNLKLKLHMIMEK